MTETCSSTPPRHYTRYAIYFAPRPQTSLAAFGRKWFGCDAETGEFGKAPNPYVNAPRHYGFHATLKAPMRLVEDQSITRFREAVRELSARFKPIDAGVPVLDNIGRFLALTLQPQFHDQVATIAWRCVTQLDEFRAELNQAEREKRTSLSPQEIQNVERWGYPYVGNAFRFHMTLSSSLALSDLVKARKALEGLIPKEPILFDSICIFGDPGNLKPFELVERFDLTA